MPERNSRGCLRVGCLGCLAVVGLVVVIVAGFVVLSLIVGAPPRDVQQEAFAQNPPDSALAWGQQVEGGAESGEIGLLPQVDEPGRIMLDLTMGEFEIVPGPAGEPVRVEAEYDTASYHLVREYEPYGENGWVYRIEFGTRLGFFRRLLGGGEDMDNKIKIILPRDVPMSIGGKVGVGESRLELGGLWLVDVDLEAGVGEHRVSFSEPAPVPLQRFRWNGNVGETSIRGLGNASPTSATVSHNVGELRVGLTGAWTRDAEVSVSINIGESSVTVPDDVNVEVARAGVNIGDSNLRGLRGREPAPEGAPTLTLSLDQNIGELRVSSD